MRVKNDAACGDIGHFEQVLAARLGVEKILNADVAALIGCSASAFNMYRSGARQLPEYHKRHMQVLLLLSDSKLKGLYNER